MVESKRAERARSEPQASEGAGPAAARGAGQRKARIALIAHSDAPWTPHYVRAFREAGHAVALLSFCPDAVEGAENVFLGRLPYDSARGKYLFATRAPRARRALAAWRPDVVLATYLVSDGLTAALAWRGPLVVSARGADVLEQAGRLPAPAWLHRPLVRFVCARATLVHAVSEELVDGLVALGVARERITCFPIGVDVAALRALRAARAGSGGRVVVCTRRHEPVYENHVLVDALAALRARGVGFRAVLAGGGRLLEARRAQVAEAGLADAVELPGQLPHTRVAELLAAGDVYVSASTSDGTSSSLLEALACGLVPVVTRIRANQDWVRDGQTGLLFAAGDAAGLSRALERALGDAALRERAARDNPLLAAERGDQRTNMARMLALLEQACAPARR
jgi:glycosyltransferase involved in cell wall biosynthesis